LIVLEKYNLKLLVVVEKKVVEVIIQLEMKNALKKTTKKIDII